MADSIRAQIVDAAAAAVATVTTANGYNTNLQKVLRAVKDPASEQADFYACVVMKDARAVRRMLPGKTVEQAKLFIYAYITRPHAKTDADELLTHAAADVRKALRADTTLTPGEGTLLDRLDWVEDRYETTHDDSRNYGGLLQIWDLQYVTDTDDPYTGRS